MQSKPRSWCPGRALSLLLALCICLLPPIYGAGAPQAQRTFVAGQILLYMQPGTPMADVSAVAALVNPASIKPLRLADCYKLVLPAAHATDQDTLAAVATLKQDARVRWVGANPIRYPLAVTSPTSEPNDPRYTSGEQWGLKIINMPQAWFLQKGAPNIDVGMIDTSFDTTHPDLIGQADPGSFNFVDNDTDLIPAGPGADAQHGTHVGGIMVAKTNNNLGIAGICWQNIKILVGRATSETDTVAGALSGDAIVNAVDYMTANKDKYHVVSINMSFGGPGDPTDVNDPEYVAIKAASDAGILMVAAAGNDATTNTAFVPAAYPFVITVSALGPSSKLASYSSFGKVDIAAPGGDINASGVLSDGILSTEAGAYAFGQGTSFAAPFVTAVLGLMMSTPGLTPQAAKQALLDGANKTGLGTLPDPKYGYGILDAYAALLKVAVGVSILTPQGINSSGQPTAPNGLVLPVQTLEPTMRFQFSNINPATVQIKVDGQVALSGTTDVQNNIDPDYPGTVPQSYVVKLRRILSQGTHTIAVSGTDVNGISTLSDTRIFTITPYTLPAGLNFFSMPYYQGPPDNTQLTQDQLLSPNFTLYRWVQSLGRYVVYPSNDPNKQLATFTPSDITPEPTGSSPTPPLGLAWFVQTSDPKQLLSYGQNFPNRTFSIPLVKGWNMIGDPYDYSISFNTATVQLPNGSQMDIDSATNLILPLIYHYVNGQYVFEDLSSGTLDPWAGQWVYVFPNIPYANLTLLLSPTEAITTSSTSSTAATASAISSTASRAVTPQTSSRAVTATTTSIMTYNADGSPRVSGSGSWVVRLVAQTHSLKDGTNFVGMTSRATTGFDNTKVPKPPMVSPYVSLGMVRTDPQASLFAQDLRPPGSTQTWNLSVATDQANSNVVLTWPNVQTVPRNYRLMLTDKVTGQTIDLRHQSSYQFTTGTGATTRSMTLTASPSASGGRPIFTSVTVNPTSGRSPTGYEISYTLSQDARVEVTILGANGRTLVQVGATRDVASGDNSIVWNGRDASGHPVPAGLYSLQLRAYTSDGAVTRDIRPFLNPGR